MATVSFEKSLKQLETIVQELEGGELPLERALKKFEEGMRLSKLCSAKLDDTEHRVALLMKDSEGVVFEKPFPNPEGDRVDE